MKSKYASVLLCIILFLTTAATKEPESRYQSNNAGISENSPQSTPAGYVEEVRGVWLTNVDSAVLLSRERIAQSMEYLASNGFNVVFPVVWNKGFTQYKSDVMADKFGENYRIQSIFRGRDPLAQIVVEAHRVGLEVIPWFEFGFSSSFSQSGGHVIQMHPDWAARNNQGQLVVKNGFDWMNGIHPEVQGFINSLIFEVIEKYDIDGIQGDDRLPAKPVEGGYDEFTRQLYADEHDGAQPPNNFRDSDWITWRSRKLTDYAEDLYNKVKGHDSTLVVSFSPSHYSFSLVEYLQNVPQWLLRGVADMVHPQLYPPPPRSTGQYRNLLRSTFGPDPTIPGGYAGRYKDITTPGMLIKAGNDLTPPARIRSWIESNREFGLKGEVLFFYDGLAERNQFAADTLGATVYSQPAILPVRKGQLRRPPGIVVNIDDDGAQRQGAWQPDFNIQGNSGFTLRAQASSNALVTWNMDVPADAWYRLYVFVPQELNATSEAYYTVYHDGSPDSTVVLLDQSGRSESEWVYLGSYSLSEGVHPVVRLSAADAGDGQRSYADAAMLLLNRKRSPDVRFDVPVVTSAPTIDDTQAQETPSKTGLGKNYPNPFNASTTLVFQLQQPAKAKLEIFDMLGRNVASLADGQMSAGTHRLVWNAGQMASGIYIARLTAGDQVFTRKLLLIK